MRHAHIAFTMTSCLAIREMRSSIKLNSLLEFENNKKKVRMNGAHFMLQ